MFKIENSHADCCSLICFPCAFCLLVFEKILICPCMCCAVVDAKISSKDDMNLSNN